MSFQAVIYRHEILPERTAAVILHRLCSAELIDVPQGKTIPLDQIKDKDIVIYGSYYSDEHLKEVIETAKSVVLHMYKADAMGRYESLMNVPYEKFRVDLVDSLKQSYALYTWIRYKVQFPIPRALTLIDLKGRSDYTTDPDVTPFIEWLYVAGDTIDRIHNLLFTGVYDLGECILLGKMYWKKSSSLISAIASSAGYYTMFAKKYKVAIVDANRPIELLGEELCKKGVEIAIITQFDHRVKKTRISMYTCNEAICIVNVARNAGYNAGGNHKISGFVTDESIAEFIHKNEVTETNV